MSYLRRPCVEVQTNREVRIAAMQTLIEYMYSVDLSWKRHLADASLTLVSPCGNTILKIDSSKVYTIDHRQPGCAWRSSKFTCQSIEEAWSMAAQAIRAYNKRKENELH